MSNDPSILKKIIRNYYGFQTFFSLLIWMPVFFEYQIRIGLSSAQIFEIQSIYYLAFCLLEIPTGILADRIGYRKCMIAGSVVLFASNLAAIYVQNFFGMTLHFLCIALSRSLISGASSAYLYDSLAFYDRSIEYKGIEGRARAYGLVAKILSWIGIGSLMNWWLTSPYWLTAIAAAISFVFAVNLPKLDFLAPIGQGATKVLKALPTARQIKEALGTIWTKPMLLLVIIQGIGLFVLGRIVQVNLFQPILSAKAFAVTSFGGIMSLMTVFEAIGSGYPEFLRRWMGDLAAVFMLTLLMAGSLLLMTPSTWFVCISALCLFSLTAGLSFPIQKQLMNDVIPRGSARATILSIESIFDRASCALVAALLGSELMDPKSLASFLNLSAAVTIAGVAALFFIMRSLAKKKERFSPGR